MSLEKKRALGSVIGTIVLSVVATGCFDPAVDGPTQLVYFPKGNCETGKIEVMYGLPNKSGNCSEYNKSQIVEQIDTVCFFRHTKYPFIDAESCFVEPTTTVNMLFVRCTDPAGKRPSSQWVFSAEKSTLTKSVCKTILP